jgi:hypothetical protein
MSRINDRPEQDRPDPDSEGELLAASGRVLARARETARRITERVWKALGQDRPEQPPDANPPALA